jgi:hypothetical protein
MLGGEKDATRAKWNCENERVAKVQTPAEADAESLDDWLHREPAVWNMIDACLSADQQRLKRVA